MAEQAAREVATAKHRTLRLALAMRGGVSLAVWIGGAVAEIDLFRRACNSPGASVTDVELAEGENPHHRDRAIIYRQLLGLTKYNGVEVDILAGASAGGLNAVLYGLAQSCGAVMDDTVRRTWVERGAIWDLLQEKGQCRVPSILQGNGRFFDVVRRALRIIAGLDSSEDEWKPLIDRNARADSVTVELAATLLDDMHNPARENRARFSFVKTPGDLTSHFTTIPGSGDDGQSAEVAVDRMALAARSTSSFPGAFEPASIYSVTGDPDPSTTGLKVDMARAFLYSRPLAEAPDAFHVIDGGIFDNIPIDRAILAIQRAPTSMPSKRWLIYLDPEPPTPSEPSTNAKNESGALSWLPVVRNSMRLKQRTESAGDELGPLRENNDTVQQIRARQEALAATLRDIQDPNVTVDELITDEAYLQCRVAMDAERIATLLRDPWTELCRPPRPAVDYTALDSTKALDIRNWLRVIYQQAAGEWDFSTDIYAMLGWVRTLIAWAHALEDVLEGLANDSPMQPQGQVCLAELLESWKRRLYRCLTVLIEAKQKIVDCVLAAPFANNPHASETYDIGTLRRSLCEGYERQGRLKLSFDLTQRLWYDDRDHAGFYNCLGSPDSLGEDIDGQPFVHSMRWIVDGIRVNMAQYSRCVVGNLPNLAGANWLRAWNESVFSQFYESPLDNLTIENLAKILVVPGGPAAVPVITYDQITSDEPPAIRMPYLEDAARATQVEMWVRSLPDDDQLKRAFAAPVLNADAKLAGNVLHRFGGFFLGRWRENDWQWGRLDAAAGIARILDRAAGTDRPPHAEAEQQLGQQVRSLQLSIMQEARETVSGGTSIVEEAGADGFDAISPQYRFALISRIVPLVYRALLPPAGSGSTVAGALAWLAQLVIRPLAVPLVLAADPLRTAWAVVVILGSAALLGAGTSPPFWQFVFAVVLGGLGVFVMTRAHKADQNWQALGDKFRELGQDPKYRVAALWQPILTNANTRPFRLASWLLGGALLAAALYYLPAVVFKGPRLCLPMELIFGALFVVVGLQHWLNQRCYRIQRVRGYTAVRRGLLLLAVAIAIGVAVVAECFARYQAHHRAPYWWDQSPVIEIVAAVAVALLTLISLWGWASRGCAWVWVVAAAGLAAGAQWFLDGWMVPAEPQWDLLPTFVWMVVLAVATPGMRYRTNDYGETDRPEIVAPQVPT
jgi:predicted acylesterase/phospholipase RssA